MLRIITLGNETLKQKAQPVTEFNKELEQLVEEMFESMHSSDGIGLAAPQIGKLLRIFICQPGDDEPRVFINPQIIQTSQNITSYEEGCLSIPGVFANVKRPDAVTIQAQNIKGKPFTIEAEGLLARVIQHEYDHLEGTLFIDHLSERKRKKVETLFASRKAM